MKTLLSVSLACAVTAMLVACSSDKSPEDEDFEHYKAILLGIGLEMECSELFAELDAMDEQSSSYGQAQDELRSIGCYMRDSVRTDTQGGDANSSAAKNPWPGVPGEKVTPSAMCLSAAKAAANELDAERANSLIAATLDACVSVNEWMSVLEAYPGVMSGAPPDNISVETACGSFPDTAVCRDASQLGLLG